MTAREFAAAYHIMNISPERMAAARAALVDGETYLAVAKRFGWTAPAVFDSARKAVEALERFKSAMDAWESFEAEESE